MFRRTIFLTLLAGLAGCATSRVSFPEVSVYGSSVVVDQLRRSTLEDGTVQVNFGGRSEVSYARSARYRVLWYDDRAFPIDTTVSAWNRFTLDGARPFEFVATGPGARGKQFKIELEVLR